MKKFNEEKIIKVLQEAEGDITVRNSVGNTRSQNRLFIAGGTISVA